VVGQGTGVKGSGWKNDLLQPGSGGEAVLDQWLGWKRGKQFGVEGGGLVLNDVSKL